MLTLKDILAQLARPGRDPREDLPAPVFKRGVIKLEDLAAGMELTGTVLNVVDFGCFVDIGMHDSGLVHVSRLADKFVRDPHDVVAVGDIVKVWVMEVDKERRRVSLTMVRPGQERPKPQPNGGRHDRQRPSGEGRTARRRPRRAASASSIPGPAAAPATARGPARSAPAPRGPTRATSAAARGRTASSASARRFLWPWQAAARSASSVAPTAPLAEAGDPDHRGHEDRQGAATDV